MQQLHTSRLGSCWGTRAPTRHCTPRPRAALHAALCTPRPHPRPWLAAPANPRPRRLPAPPRCSGNPQPTPPADDTPTGFLPSLFRSLRDFGIGRKSIWEGGVGLFVLLGAGFCVALVNWARGSALRKGRPYMATVEFPQACGITVGTPVRIRGVQVGSVLDVKPSLQRVEVLVEVNDAASVIPRNSLVEANQSGLIAEPLLDITPRLPIPEIKAGPLDAECHAEGAIVCAGEHIVGVQGVALDDLVYICTKLARQMDEQGVDKVFAAAEAATEAIRTATPLIEEANALVRELTPLLAELRQGGLTGNLDELTEAAAGTMRQLQQLQAAVLTDDNVAALRDSVRTLTRTLQHVEGISGSVGRLSGEPATQRNLRSLIEALSRIVDE